MRTTQVMLIFEDARVSKDNLLDEEGKGYFYLMEKLQQERLLVAIHSLKAAEMMLEETIEYVKQRIAFGQPISKFQNTQFKIAKMKTVLEIGRTFIDRLIEDHMEKNRL